MKFALNRISIAQKLPAVIVLSALVVSAAVGYAGYQIGATTVQRLTEDRLQSIATERAQKVQLFLDDIAANVVQLSGTALAQDAERLMETNWSQMDNPSASIRKSFIDENPNASNERWKLALSQDQGSRLYNFSHNGQHPGLLAELQARGYVDLFIFDLAGDLLYTVNKNDDFATNFAPGGNGKYTGTGLGKAFAAASAFKDPGHVAFADDASYGPAGNIRAAFAATTIFAKDGTPAGVLAVELPLDKINLTMASRNGMGETGETFLVGNDHLMRSDSTFTDGDDYLKTKFDAPMIDAAFAGNMAQGTYAGYRDTPMITTAVPINYLDQHWALVSVIAQSEAFAAIDGIRNMMLAIGAGLLVVIAGLGFLFSRSITTPMTRLTRTMQALSSGDLGAEVRGTNRRDELGAMAQTVEVFKQNAIKMGELTDGERAASDQRRVDRATMMQQLQRAFGEVVEAASAGDFSRRVQASFPDAELNALAGSVNGLVATVERGLGETGKVLSSLARTDLSHRVAGEYKGAFAQLKSDTNAVASRLTDIVGQLRDTSQSLKTATRELLTGATDLSQRTTMQAATIEETSATMEELAGTVQSNAKKAEEAARCCRRCRQDRQRRL